MLSLPRKLKLRAHGAQVVFTRGLNESGEHVLMKALLWALYLPEYPGLTVEIRVGDRYKPDVVAYDRLPDGRAAPRFWGESGQVGRDKIHALVRRYRDTHFAMAKWNTGLYAYESMVKEALAGVVRHAPFDLLCFPADSYRRFVREGEVHIRHQDVTWLRLTPEVR